MTDDDWATFQLEELLEKKADMSFPYLEFIRSPALSSGIYSLRAGSKDLQGPHDEDELYLVLEGRGRIRVGDDDSEVRPGSIIFVRATAEHRFVEIDEDMKLLVFFARS